MNTGDVSGAFEFFAHAMARYRYETANGTFKRHPGDPATVCPMGIDETTYYKLVAALVKETHADHASEVARAMAAFGLRMSVKRFTEVIAAIPCRTRAKEALAFVDACCRGADLVGEETASTSSSTGGVLEFGDLATAAYYTKNVRLLVMEFCEESNQIMERIKKRSPKSLEQAGTCSLNLVAKPSKLKGGRLCLSTPTSADAPNVITRMACLKSLESNDGKRGVQVGDSILVRRYQPPVEQEEPESEPEPVNQIAANSSLKVTAAAFVPRPKAPKPLAAPETPVEEYEGVIEIVPYTLNELHIKLDHGDGPTTFRRRLAHRSISEQNHVHASNRVAVRTSRAERSDEEGHLQHESRVSTNSHRRLSKTGERFGGRTRGGDRLAQRARG